MILTPTPPLPTYLSLRHSSNSLSADGAAALTTLGRLTALTALYLA
jgi:hypothetical protein